MREGRGGIEDEGEGENDKTRDGASASGQAWSGRTHADIVGVVAKVRR